MHDPQFDRLARILSGSSSRRQALAALATLALVRPTPAHAAQVEVAACSAEGDVCTHLVGCCDGLVCATSMINTNYGVCIPGDGDHLAVTDQLVVPDSAGITAELGAALTDTEADAAAAAEILDARAEATDTRRDEQQTRQGTKKANKRSRKDRKQARRRSRNGSRNDAPGAADRDCADFATQQKAQDFWDRKGYSSTNDPHGLDPDGDEIPCEDLP
jgi:hypothetical protein